jgi:hypothetical protein
MVATHAATPSRATRISCIWSPAGELQYANGRHSNCTEVEDPAIYLDVPACFALRGNAPNPFNPATNISFDVPISSHVKLVVFDAAGRRVRTLVNQELAAGVYTHKWDGCDDKGRSVASGVYLYRMQARSFAKNKRMTLIR